MEVPISRSNHVFSNSSLTAKMSTSSCGNRAPERASPSPSSPLAHLPHPPHSPTHSNHAHHGRNGHHDRHDRRDHHDRHRHHGHHKHHHHHPRHGYHEGLFSGDDEHYAYPAYPPLITGPMTGAPPFGPPLPFCGGFRRNPFTGRGRGGHGHCGGRGQKHGRGPAFRFRGLLQALRIEQDMIKYAAAISTLVEKNDFHHPQLAAVLLRNADGNLSEVQTFLASADLRSLEHRAYMLEEWMSEILSPFTVDEVDNTTHAVKRNPMADVGCVEDDDTDDAHVAALEQRLASLETTLATLQYHCQG